MPFDLESDLPMEENNNESAARNQCYGEDFKCCMKVLVVVIGFIIFIVFDLNKTNSAAAGEAAICKWNVTSGDVFFDDNTNVTEIANNFVQTKEICIAIFNGVVFEVDPCNKFFSSNNKNNVLSLKDKVFVILKKCNPINISGQLCINNISSFKLINNFFGKQSAKAFLIEVDKKLYECPRGK